MRAHISMLCSALVLASSPMAAPALHAADGVARKDLQSGTITVRSAYPMAETVDRLWRDIAGKGIRLFLVLDQSKLAADARTGLHPSVLLLFGNVALGAQYIAANPASGLDWPVRIVVFEKPAGEVWVAYTDFGAIARRHGISDRDEVFRIASGVVASITASIAAK